jgi:hypothetical protein
VLVAWYYRCMTTTWCANPECGEEFDATEVSNDFCSWACEARASEIEDEEN